jgi:hypothetical protein
VDRKTGSGHASRSPSPDRFRRRRCLSSPWVPRGRRLEPCPRDRKWLRSWWCSPRDQRCGSASDRSCRTSVLRLTQRGSHEHASNTRVTSAPTKKTSSVTRALPTRLPTISPNYGNCSRKRRQPKEEVAAGEAVEGRSRSRAGRSTSTRAKPLLVSVSWPTDLRSRRSVQVKVVGRRLTQGPLTRVKKTREVPRLILLSTQTPTTPSRPRVSTTCQLTSSVAISDSVNGSRRCPRSCHTPVGSSRYD